MNKGQRQKRSEKYLLPLLTNGPNNQIRGLKWALVMAKMLDRFVLMCTAIDRFVLMCAAIYKFVLMCAVIMITNALSSSRAPCPWRRTLLLTGIFDHKGDAEAHGFATFFPLDLLWNR